MMYVGEFAKMHPYLARGQRVRIDNDYFTPREQSGILKSISQGYWLSSGRIAWLGRLIAEEYELPYIWLRKSQYGALCWNKYAGAQPGMSEAITSVYAMVRMVEEDLSDFKKRAFEHAIKDPANYTAVYVSQVTDVVRAQFAGLNKGMNDKIKQFHKDWGDSNLWVHIT